MLKIDIAFIMTILDILNNYSNQFFKILFLSKRSDAAIDKFFNHIFWN